MTPQSSVNFPKTQPKSSSKQCKTIYKAGHESRFCTSELTEHAEGLLRLHGLIGDVFVNHCGEDLRQPGVEDFLSALGDGDISNVEQHALREPRITATSQSLPRGLGIGSNGGLRRGLTAAYPCLGLDPSSTAESGRSNGSVRDGSASEVWT